LLGSSVAFAIMTATGGTIITASDVVIAAAMRPVRQLKPWKFRRRQTRLTQLTTLPSASPSNRHR